MVSLAAVLAFLAAFNDFSISATIFLYEFAAAIAVSDAEVEFLTKDSIKSAFGIKENYYLYCNKHINLIISIFNFYDR